MIKSIYKNLTNVQGRSKVVAKNAVISLFLKGFSILVSFWTVPLYFHAVGQRQYGIILTITSVSNFISFFDVGIGNGLRSKLGKTLAEGNVALSRQYVSTSYFYVTILFTSVFLAYCIAAPWLDWFRILNIHQNEVPGLDSLMLIVFGLFCARFIFQLFGTVLMADQKSYLSDIMGFSHVFLYVVFCVALRAASHLNFYSLLIVMVVLPVVMPAIFSIIYFSTRYKWLRPSFKMVNHTLRKDILGLGFKFFLIQIAGIVIFTTTNILIAQLFDIGEVTRYNIAFKYYNITVVVFTVLMSPLWGAFANAWYKNDIKWIVKNIKFYLAIILVLTVGNIIQYYIYPYFSHFWLRRTFVVPTLLAISLMLYNIIFCYNDIFAHFLASVGQVNKQMYAAIAGGVINIPVTIYLAKYTNAGLSAILFANIICLLPSTVVTTIQTVSILRSKLTGNTLDL